MADQKFPFGLDSKSALVCLIKKTYPHREINPRFVVFGDLYSDPTEQEPGRTFVEMTDLEIGEKDWYVYRRLDIKEVIKDDTPLHVEPPISPASIIKTINQTFGLALSEKDTSVSTKKTPIQTANQTYTLVIDPESYVYYGTKVINISPTALVDANVLNEDGSFMQQEDGFYVLLESA